MKFKFIEKVGENVVVRCRFLFVYEKNIPYLLLKYINLNSRLQLNNKKRSLAIASDLGAPEETRTPDLLIRSQTLYPAELPAHILLAFSPENVSYL